MKWRSIAYPLLLSSVLTLNPLPVLAANQLGKVDFPIACKAASQAKFNDGLALVHHMMYIQAEKTFNDILAQDPQCGMAYWGIALAQIHPLWGGLPTEAVMIKGQQAFQKAQSLVTNAREKAFVEALKPLYHDWRNTPYVQRLAQWEKAQNKLYQQYPQDPDALALYTLAHLAIAPKSDKNYTNQKRAGKLLEAMNKQHPMHPAGYHYTIHAYDNPKLAKLGEPYARGYDKIAPNVPHALHMPSHIFVRLGQWPETINWNKRSAAAARAQYLKGGVMSMHYAHATDYLVYAYLQQGRIKAAANVLSQLNSVRKFQDSFPAAYGIAASRARYYLEQSWWRAAANIPIEKPKDYPWHKYPAVESITYFARGIGNARIGKLTEAQKYLNQLDQFHKTLTAENKTYWAVLVRAKERALAAWIAYEKGQYPMALQLMQSAADLEDSVDKHPVTPSEVLPAREQLGDMLLALKLPKAGLIAFQKTLAISPNRLNSLYGAGRAAELMGDKPLATLYYRKVVEQTAHADSELKQVEAAKAYLKKSG